MGNRSANALSAVVVGMAENRNPYDTLFRGAFADPGAGKELTLFLLPEQHSRRLAGAQVTVEPESLIDQDARARYTDLLLQFRRPGGRDTPGSSAYVYVLYEHKSYPYRWVTVQLLLYMTTLWQRLTGEIGAASERTVAGDPAGGGVSR
jgi:hypothetical protein